MHPGPINRGVEIESAVADGPQSVILNQVTYGIAIFTETDDRAAAQGHFVHVFVDRVTRRAAPIPDPIRAALQRISVVG